MLKQYTNPNDRLPSLSDTVRKYELRAKKSLGQNFLLDLNICHKLASLAGDLSGCTVIEIGSGPGGLTRAILQADASKVFIIEKDLRAIDVALQIQEVWGKDKLIILHEDALKVDMINIDDNPNKKIIANLPYNISTKILTNLLLYASEFLSLTLMFQKEVALRIVSQPDLKSYSRLSVLAQWLCDVSIDMILPARLFSPAPKVDSAMVTFKPLPKPRYDAEFSSMEKILKVAFGQRRKMLRQSLKPLFKDKLSRIMEECNIDTKKRAENLTVKEFCLLSNYV